jgi:hypothetical protein
MIHLDLARSVQHKYVTYAYKHVVKNVRAELLLLAEGRGHADLGSTLSCMKKCVRVSFFLAFLSSAWWLHTHHLSLIVYVSTRLDACLMNCLIWSDWWARSYIVIINIDKGSGIQLSSEDNKEHDKDNILLGSYQTLAANHVVDRVLYILPAAGTERVCRKQQQLVIDHHNTAQSIRKRITTSN